MGIMSRRRLKAEKKKPAAPVEARPNMEKPKPTEAKPNRKMQKIPASLLDAKDD